MKTIHRYWTGPAHPGQAWLDNVLRRMAPRWSLREWQGTEMEAWAAGFDAQVRASDVPRHRANLIRYRALLELGGVWLDHDMLLLAPLDVRGLETAVMGNQRVGCYMAGTAGWPELQGLLDEVLSQPPSNRPAPHVSGVHRLTHHLQAAGRRPDMCPHNLDGKRLSPVVSAVHLFWTGNGWPQ